MMLRLQLWDRDSHSADDFLGEVALSAAEGPSGAEAADVVTARSLTLAFSTDSTAANIFRPLATAADGRVRSGGETLLPSYPANLLPWSCPVRR